MMDYAKEYDRMVERSNKQLERIERQNIAIQQLREALTALVYEGHWSADEQAKVALAATENQT
jgi:hypothetical protein